MYIEVRTYVGVVCNYRCTRVCHVEDIDSKHVHVHLVVFASNVKVRVGVSGLA